MASFAPRPKEKLAVVGLLLKQERPSCGRGWAMEQEATVTERRLRSGKRSEDGETGRPDPFATFPGGRVADRGACRTRFHGVHALIFGRKIKQHFNTPRDQPRQAMGWRCSSPRALATVGWQTEPSAVFKPPSSSGFPVTAARNPLPAMAWM